MRPLDKPAVNGADPPESTRNIRALTRKEVNVECQRYSLYVGLLIRHLGGGGVRAPINTSTSPLLVLFKAEVLKVLLAEDLELDIRLGTNCGEEN